MTGDDTGEKSGDQPEQTIFSPTMISVAPGQAMPVDGTAPEQSGMPAAQSAAPVQTAALSTASGAAPVAIIPRRIQVGDILNHIFEVKRFIARGGMGEVFEGVNVNSDERVAIKVILPNLAADPNVQAMFRKEARTLTRLGHPALVQYRVLAQEPVLGVFYIVTEYVDGQNLSDVLRELNPTAEDMVMLTRRLAEGLNAAHALGAIHRDISPDNVMLEGGRLDKAKIIDFGIAKDLDPGTATIVGDGFAGKLNYVAPEQLGDFDREVGPWTDVYSLGLVILALALRRDVNMGATLVDAVDKRRAGPDLSVIPESLRPVLEKMLKANPAERLRSMKDVLDMLEGRVHSAPAAPAPAQPDRKAAKKQAKAPSLPLDGAEAGGTKIKLPLIAGGGAALAAILGAGLYLTIGSGDAPVATGQGGDAATVGAAPSDPVSAARAALESGLPSIQCTWLDLAGISQDNGTLNVAMRGVAGKPAEAQQQVAQLLEAKGIRSVAIDFNDVAPIGATECGPLEAFRQIRDPASDHLTVAQRRFEMGKLASGDYAGSVGAQAVINFKFAGDNRDASLFGLEPSGEITMLAPDKATLESVTENIGGQHRLTIDVTHTGWSGLLMLSGATPFDEKLIAGPAGSRTGDWSQRFLDAARKGGWTAEMVWFQTVDQVPN